MTSDKPSQGKRPRIWIITILVISLLTTVLAYFLLFTPPTLKLGGTAEFSSYSEGRPRDGRLKLTADSPQYPAIENWLNQRRSWTPDFNSYAPGDSITSDSLQINVQGNRVILNLYRKSGWRWTQYHSPADAEIKRLVKELREQLAAQEGSRQSP